MHIEKTTSDTTIKLYLDSFTAQKDFSAILAHDILNNITDIADNCVTFDLCITSFISDITEAGSKQETIPYKETNPQ